MGRLTIADLPYPAPAYRITSLPVPPDAKMLIESPSFAWTETAIKRALRLRKNAFKGEGLYTPKQANRLGKELANATRHKPKSPANSIYMGDFRFRLIGGLWELVEEGPWGVPTFFTGRPLDWEFSAPKLNRRSARKLMKQLRQRLLRAGAAGATGWLVAFLHGEFEPESGRYVLHFHGFATGEMVDVLERLRGTKAKPGWLAGGRLNRNRKPITNLPYVLGYGFKSFWPCKRIGPVGTDGKIKRNRFVSRIPEPFHSQHLIWLHQQSVADMSLLMKLRVGPEGFVLND